MAYISSITLPNNVTYDLKGATELDDYIWHNSNGLHIQTEKTGNRLRLDNSIDGIKICTTTGEWDMKLAEIGKTSAGYYFTFGQRQQAYTYYNSTSTYAVGDMCIYSGNTYICTTEITTPESWTSSHWKLAFGTNSIAEGNGIIASGNYSHAEGYGTIASENCSHAEGNGTTASGGDSHVEGNWTIASGTAAHAEGTSTTASGNSSHTEGCDTIASGPSAHAEGGETIASGSCSHAGGYYTTAQGKSQTVIGEYNVLDTAGSTFSRGDYAFIIGNGTSTSSRSNALTVDWNGNLSIQGSITDGNGNTLSDKTTVQIVRW